MSEPQPTGEERKGRGWALGCAVWCAVLVAGGWIYVRTHPLVFNESFHGHAHCIVCACTAFNIYASDHGGMYPAHTNGYGDALLLLFREDPTVAFALTGPGYDPGVFGRAATNRTNVPESECGRVYIQGLSERTDPGVALLFDKLPTPGGDHCHGLARLFAPLCREVAFANGSHETIRESNWPEFSKKQIELLVKAGFPRGKAEASYAEARKPQ